MPSDRPQEEHGAAAPGLEAMYATMARIRAFETRVGKHFRDGDIHGFVHVSIGQEAVAVGVCSTLRSDDPITTTHRGHGHCIAKGADPPRMFAELFGRSTGLCSGRGGSMHIADPSLGILGANGIVAAGIPLAVGAALAARDLHDGRVAVAFFGEGAVHSGAFHEALTLAVAWQVPALLVCENNGYAEFTRAGAWGGAELTSRVASYGMPAESIDGGDAVQVAEAVADRVGRCRDGAGPAFLEARTVRFGGHFEGDAQEYRTAEELADRERHDPLKRAREAVGAPEADALVAAAEAEMDDAVAEALEAPYPDAGHVDDFVYA